MKTQSHLGFPAPLLGVEPVRLPVLHDDGEMLVLAKPSGILVQQDSWYPRLPVLIEAIRYQAAEGKPEFAKMEIGPAGLWAVTDLDPECAGPVLLTRSREAGEELKNQYGSGNFTFTFEILTQSNPTTDSIDCDLPISRHGRLSRMLVSHTTGKVSKTTFTDAERVGSYTLCQAKTNYPRRHQVLLHALESGLPVLGDRTYARSSPVMLSRIKRDYQLRRDRDERPLYPSPAYYLKELKIGPDCLISMPPPLRWPGLIKQLRKYSR